MPILIESQPLNRHEDGDCLSAVQEGSGYVRVSGAQIKPTVLSDRAFNIEGFYARVVHEPSVRPEAQMVEFFIVTWNEPDVLLGGVKLKVKVMPSLAGIPKGMPHELDWEMPRHELAHCFDDELSEGFGESVLKAVAEAALRELMAPPVFVPKPMMQMQHSAI